MEGQFETIENEVPVGYCEGCNLPYKTPSQAWMMGVGYTRRKVWCPFSRQLKEYSKNLIPTKACIANRKIIVF